VAGTKIAPIRLPSAPPRATVSGMSPKPVLRRVRNTFRAVVQTVAPRATAFEEEEWAWAESLVEDALAQRPKRVRRQVVRFLRLLDLVTIPWYGWTFTGLSDGQRLRVLRTLERSSIPLIRRGVWGVRTLGFLAVYGQEDIQARIGYRPDYRGWDVRPEAASAATHGHAGAEDQPEPGEDA
jgi:hypothetical protein